MTSERRSTDPRPVVEEPGTGSGRRTTCRPVNHRTIPLRTASLVAPFAALALTLSLAACGSDDDASDTPVAASPNTSEKDGEMTGEMDGEMEMEGGEGEMEVICCRLAG